jgi:hypothetical protein
MKTWIYVLGFGILSVGVLQPRHPGAFVVGIAIILANGLFNKSDE